MSVESLLWPTGEAAIDAAAMPFEPGELRALFTDNYQLDDPDRTAPSRSNRKDAVQFKPWTLESDRYQTWLGVGDNAAVLWSWLVKGPGSKLAPALGIVLDEHHPPPTVFRSESSHRVAVEVHSVRTAVRRSPRGAPTTDLVVEITQRRRCYYDKDKQTNQDASTSNIDPNERGDFRYRAGCTLLINPTTLQVRRVIRTPGTISDDVELDRMRRFLTGSWFEPSNAFDSAYKAMHAREPFALVHRTGEIEHYG